MKCFDVEGHYSLCKMDNRPMPRFYVMESVAIAPKQYLERQVYRSFTNEETAKRACSRAAKDDNQPFVINQSHEVIHTGPKGKNYGN